MKPWLKWLLLGLFLALLGVIQFIPGGDAPPPRPGELAPALPANR